MRARSLDTFGTRSTLSVNGKNYEIYRLSALEKTFASSRLPFTLKIFLENMLRHEDGRFVKADDIRALASSQAAGNREVFFMPGRVLMQDFTGVPAVVDLAAMRDAMQKLGGDPRKINPLVPVDLVIDHSVQVDKYGTPDAFAFNAQAEFERNQQRYLFLKWGQKALKAFSVVPPETGIVHQVNLEFLANVVAARSEDGATVVFPDSLVGTDSHTTMINGLGVLGWGVGGIEAEAVMLGQPMSMLIPEVLGFKLTGKLSPGATATDAVLTVTELLRKKGVVGKFVEFFGPGLSQLSLADRATISNMCPEYGATVAFFPVDAQAIEYMKLTGRPAEHLAVVEAYCKAQGLFRVDGAPDPVFSETVELDLGSVEPSLAGPRRPQDRVALADAREAWRRGLGSFLDKKDKKGQLPAPAGTKVPVSLEGQRFELEHDSVVIAAITSCTNTSNPSVLIGAGLLAQKAVERGLTVKPWVKTSLAPGSKVVTEYLRESGLLRSLEALRFHLVGYG
ncbi:MAG: aconitate hydratase AcnA, partial [Elusimicrobia bacterium]|nr:aconitate hydratase AcnA [Elusimicrobiota bacterium]